MYAPKKFRKKQTIYMYRWTQPKVILNTGSNFLSNFANTEVVIQPNSKILDIVLPMSMLKLLPVPTSPCPTEIIFSYKSLVLSAAETLWRSSPSRRNERVLFSFIYLHYFRISDVVATGKPDSHISVTILHYMTIFSLEKHNPYLPSNP